MESRTYPISILVVNYNNGKYFKDCYDSLIAQTYRDFEVLILDDASTDNSVEIISQLIKGDERFRFYQNEENIGYQRSLVKAIELSTSGILGRLDPDDALLPEAVEKSLQVHKDYPEVGLVYSNMFRCDELLTPFNISNRIQIEDSNYIMGGDEISHFVTFKRDIYAKTLGIDIVNKRAEDKDIYLKMIEVAPVKMIEAPLYMHRVLSSSQSHGPNKMKSCFWHWYALIKAIERRGGDFDVLEDLFAESFIKLVDHKSEISKKHLEICQRESEIKKYKNIFAKLQLSRWVKLGRKLGMLKFLDYLK